MVRFGFAAFGCWLRATALLVLIATAGQAETPPLDPVAAPTVAALVQQGYDNIEVERTWLGRVRILAWMNGQQREIILHPTSGEVLRDLQSPGPTRFARSDEATDKQTEQQVRTATAASAPTAPEPLAVDLGPAEPPEVAAGTVASAPEASAPVEPGAGFPAYAAP